MVWIPRLAAPIITFLVGAGLEVSGFEDFRVALALWSFAGFWALIALLVPVLTRWRAPTWFVIPLLRDRIHWKRYAPAVTLANNAIGAKFELATHGATVYRARAYATFNLRSRDPFGRASVSFVDCRMDVRPLQGRIRGWHRLILGHAHQGITVEIPHGEVRIQAFEFMSPQEGEDLAKNPRMDYDFDWKITGITARLLDGKLSGAVPIFRGRSLGKVDR